jgi:hypothetical protein
LLLSIPSFAVSLFDLVLFVSIQQFNGDPTMYECTPPLPADCAGKPAESRRFDHTFSVLSDVTHSIDDAISFIKFQRCAAVGLYSLFVPGGEALFEGELQATAEQAQASGIEVSGVKSSCCMCMV